MEITPVYYVIACIIFIVLCIVFAKPLKGFFKIVISSFLGCVAIMLFNFVGGIFGLFLGMNAFTAVTVGILGLPGFISLFILKLLV